MIFEQGIRGGITHISKRYSEANDKYMKDFDPKNHPNLLLILMQIILKDGQCLNDFQLTGLNG